MPAGSSRPLLLLWDIDGTLLQRASREHGLALRQAIADVHAVPAVDGHRVEYAGRTDWAIARDLARGFGVPADALDARMAEVLDACWTRYSTTCPSDLRPTVTPGIPAVLRRLADRPEAFRLSLLTGNVEPVARLKLERAGLGEYFPSGQGAFGSDAEARADLPRIARERAGGWPRERTVVIGDTPLDIACARADEVRVVAVATGPFGASELAGADALLPSPEGLEDVLDRLAVSEAGAAAAPPTTLPDAPASA